MGKAAGGVDPVDEAQSLQVDDVRKTRAIFRSIKYIIVSQLSRKSSSSKLLNVKQII